jgi:hypothetical protein
MRAVCWGSKPIWETRASTIRAYCRIEARRLADPAGKQEIVGSQASAFHPLSDRLSRWLGDLELNGSLCLLLHDNDSRRDSVTVRYIADGSRDRKRQTGRSSARLEAAQLAFNARLGSQRVAALHALIDDCIGRLADEEADALGDD